MVTDRDDELLPKSCKEKKKKDESPAVTYVRPHVGQAPTTTMAPGPPQRVS